MKAKSKTPPLEKDKSTTEGKAGTEIEPPEKGSGDHPDGLSTDEMAVFEKIIGEIENQGADQGTLETIVDDEATADTPKDEPEAPETTDDVDAELEMVVTGANTTEHPASDGDDSDGNLDDDQQKAFESIMAQIEGDATGGTSQDEPEAPETTDDVDAELEMVATGTNTTEHPASDGDDSDGNLDDDQQKAFENIMAQIEGDATGGTGSADIPKDEPEAPETTDDFAAELEKVAKEAETVGDSPSPGDGSDANPGGNPQKSDVPPSTGSDGTRSEKAATDSGPTAMKTSAPPEAQSNAAGLKSDDADDAIQDISDDINDILKEITTSDEGPDLKDSDHDDIVVHENQLPDPEQDKFPETSPAPVKKENIVVSEEEPATDPSPENQNTKPTPLSSRLKSPPPTKPLREAWKSTGSRKKKTIFAFSGAIIICALAGYFFYGDPKYRVNSTAQIPAPTNSPMNADGGLSPTATTQTPAIIDEGPSDGSRLKAAADNLDRLRNEVIEKQVEIDELRAYYRSGIDSEIQGLVDSLHQADRGKLTFNEAKADPRISLALAAIQRRDSYIKKLQIPLNDLFRNSEELLFLSRKAGLLAMIAEKTSDIDIDGFIQLADETSNTQRSALAQLNIDGVAAPPLPLKSIWDEIAQRLQEKPVSTVKNRSAAGTDNPDLSKRICNGDYSEKHKLTELSPEAARCLAKWKGKDLFLNAVIHLSPDAARELAAWEGNWLGLNGIKELSPEAAVHLARWQGKGLSLNGISHLSPRVVAILSEWQGDQIELVHVKHMAHWENAQTRLFLSENLKRKQKATRN